MFGIWLIADFVYSRFTTVKVNGDYITLYIGVLHSNGPFNIYKRFPTDRHKISTPGRFCLLGVYVAYVLFKLLSR